MAMSKCNKDCLNCELKACIYDVEDSYVNNIVRGETVGLNDRLRMILKKKRVRQKVLAKNTGITEPTISAYCRGTRNPRADHIVVICRELNISADWLLGMERE